MKRHAAPLKQRTAFELVEGFHLGQAMAALNQLGVLDAISHRSLSARILARRNGLDRVTLQGVLSYVAVRTNLVRRTGERFATTKQYDSTARFLLDLYAGAFGEHAKQLAEILRNPDVGRGLVDRARHARAFERAGTTEQRPIATVVKQLGLTRVVDIGCGSADLLIQMAKADAAFVGWGIDASPTMNTLARARIQRTGLRSRVRVVKADARRLATALPESVRRQIDGVTACQIANEMFGRGVGAAAAWLRQIRRAFPGRPVIIGDYYGRLGTHLQDGDGQTLLHDYVQLLSGQGVPPSMRRQWQRLYTAAGYRLAWALEDRETTQFIHVLL